MPKNVTVGSPPRVRGTVQKIQKVKVRQRITPACAGNRPRCYCNQRNRGDHPRVCGEQMACNQMHKPCRGSPPRVRGTAVPVGRYHGLYRITPACAGNRKRSFQSKALKKDHPRVCGEQLLLPKRRLPRTGSPPRVRGTVIDFYESKGWMGITPACAGNSSLPTRPNSPMKDHPRVCGEQLPGLSRYSLHQGSPPRVRGTGPINSFVKPVKGITPACAGNRVNQNGPAARA